MLRKGALLLKTSPPSPLAPLSLLTKIIVIRSSPSFFRRLSRRPDVPIGAGDHGGRIWRCQHLSCHVPKVRSCRAPASPPALPTWNGAFGTSDTGRTVPRDAGDKLQRLFGVNVGRISPDGDLLGISVKALLRIIGMGHRIMRMPRIHRNLSGWGCRWCPFAQAPFADQAGDVSAGLEHFRDRQVFRSSGVRENYRGCARGRCACRSSARNAKVSTPPSRNSIG